LPLLQLLHEFQGFLDGISTTPVTLEIDNLLKDILENYHQLLEMDVPPFSCHDQVDRFARNFVFSRDCFFYPEGRLPVVEATFAKCSFAQMAANLDIEIFYSWAQPLLHFPNLRNAVHEGEEYRLRPCAINTRTLDSISPCDVEFSVGPSEPWLTWDESRQCLCGTVPDEWASWEGSDRLPVYTILIDILARIKTHFPCDIILERQIRCILPLTVKRRPRTCGVEGERVASPPRRHTSGSMTLESVHAARTQISASADRLNGKENAACEMKKLCAPLNLKVDIPRHLSSPITCDASYLAQLSDTAQPRCSTDSTAPKRNVEVRDLWLESPMQHNSSPLYDPLQLGSPGQEQRSPSVSVVKDEMDGLGELPSFQSDL
jgi:hypothetical protein